MQESKSTSKQVLAYLYRYTIEKSISKVINLLAHYRKIGMILWEVGHHIYEIMSNASEDDKMKILNEIQQKKSSRD
jgi:hypothetical protein